MRKKIKANKHEKIKWMNETKDNDCKEKRKKRQKTKRTIKIRRQN